MCFERRDLYCSFFYSQLVYYYLQCMLYMKGISRRFFLFDSCKSIFNRLNKSFYQPNSKMIGYWSFNYINIVSVTERLYLIAHQTFCLIQSLDRRILWFSIYMYKNFSTFGPFALSWIHAVGYIEKRSIVGLQNQFDFLDLVQRSVYEDEIALQGLQI